MSKRTQKKLAPKGKEKEIETPMAQTDPKDTNPGIWDDYTPDSGDDYEGSDEDESLPSRKGSSIMGGMDTKGRTRTPGLLTPTVSTTSKQVESVTPYKLRPVKLTESFIDSSSEHGKTRDMGRSNDMVQKNLEEELYQCSQAYSKLPLLNVLDSPHFVDVSGFNTEQLKTWQTSADAWDMAEKRKKVILEHIRHLREQLTKCTPDRVEPARTHVRPLKVDRHLPIPKFDRALSRDKPFYIWYKLFKREMLRLEADNRYCLAALIYYVDKECFSPWQESLSPEDMNDLDIVLSYLDKEFPDRCTPEERRSAFRNSSHSKADVLDYSNNKERLFRLAYPEKDPNTSATYKDYWLLGLNKKLETLLRRSIRVEDHSISYLVAEAVRIEQNELAVNKARYLSHFPRGYEDRHTGSDRKKSIAKKPTRKPYGHRDKVSSNMPYKPRDKTSSSIGPSRKEETEMVKGICFAYQKTGKCTRGRDCPYEHPWKGGKSAPIGGDGKSKDLKM